MIAAALLMLANVGTQAATAASPALSVPAKWHLIDGIASDGKRVWVSSVVDRAILEVQPGGTVDAIHLPKDLGAPFGLLWDPGRKWIWAAVRCPAEPAIAHCGKSALIAVDPSGKVVRALAPGGPFAPGDVSLDPGRDRIFVSDSGNGAVWGCEGACLWLRPAMRPSARSSSRGSALAPDENTLIVADYYNGIFAINVATGRQRLVTTPLGVRLRGMDGLVRVGGTYVGIQNGTPPDELVAFEIGADGSLADVREVPTSVPLGEATQLVHAGDRLLIVGDAQWRHYRGDHPDGADAQMRTPIIAVPLSALGG